MKPLLRSIGLTFLLLLCGACDTTTAAEHLDQARGYFESGEYRTAVIELKNALQKDADQGDARLLLGRAQAQLGDFPSALKEFERALDLGVNDPLLEVGLLDSKNRLGRHQEVIGALEERGALAPQLAVVLANAYMASSDLAKAKPLYQQALNLATGNMGLGTIAWAQGDLPRAASYLGKAVEMDPANREAWMRKGEFDLSQQAYGEAESAFMQSSKLPGGDLTGKLGLARTYLAQQRFEDAAVQTSAVLEAAPGAPAAHYLDGLIKYQQQDIDGAEAALREVQRALPSHGPTLYLMGAVKFQQGQLSQAEDSLKRYMALDPQNESAAKLLASVYLQQSDLDGVEQALEPFVAGSQDPQLLAMAGTTQLRQGNVVEATGLLERAVALAPDAAVFRNQLALGLLSAGEEDKARVELESAISVDESQFQSDYLLAMLSMKNRDYASALEAIEALIVKNPDAPLGFNLKGAALLGQADEAGAREAFTQALSIAPDFLPAAANLARLDQRAGDLVAARSRYEAILAVSPDNEGARLALADLAAADKDLDGAVSQLEEIIAVNPDSLRARIGLLRLHLLQNQVSAAATQADVALRLAPDLPDVILLAAEVALRKGDVAAARDLGERLQGLVADRENPTALLVALGALQSQVGQLTLARRNLEQALQQSDGGSGRSLLELARLDLRDNDVEAARARLDDLKKLGADDGQLGLLEADILQVEGNRDEAKARYAQLAQSGVREGAVRFAMLNMAGNELDVAIDSLDSWLAEHPQDLGMKLLRADALMRQQDQASAVAQYEELVDADNPVVLNNLAWLYMERGDERALTMAQRAYELAPDNPDIADTLGWILVRSGQPDQAIEYIRQSVQLKPDNATVRYHLGVAYMEAGRSRAARTALEEAIEQGSFPEIDEARAKLAELSDA